MDETSDIDKALCFRLLEELKNLDVEEVGLFWMGEPLMNNDLPEYVSYAKDIGIKYVFITTNGLLAKQRMMEKLFESGLDSIKFSINAPTREKYVSMCGVDGFEKVVSNIKGTWQLRGDGRRPLLYASSIVEPGKKEEFDVINSIIGPYVDQHYPIRLYGKQKIARQGERYSVIDSPKEELRTLESMLPCWCLFTEPHISRDGYLGACHNSLDSKFFMGNLNEVSIMDAWHSEKYMALRRKHLLKDVKGSVCENCAAFV
jgi:radical SAM protein with 4Fe4S-binding SPASM domain